MFSNFFKKIWAGWKVISQKVGWINNFILLSIFYFLAVGFIFFAKKVLALFSPKIAKESYWISRENKPDNQDFRNQF